jgi:hypothetical protein
LSADEVYEWLRHAVQVYPSAVSITTYLRIRRTKVPEWVARPFREHAVTGYDFPELIENEGLLLETVVHEQHCGEF